MCSFQVSTLTINLHQKELHMAIDDLIETLTEDIKESWQVNLMKLLGCIAVTLPSGTRVRPTEGKISLV